jgi:hypothetical protein
MSSIAWPSLGWSAASPERTISGANREGWKTCAKAAEPDWKAVELALGNFAAMMVRS